MAFKYRFLIIASLLFIGFLSCDKSPSDPDSEDPQLPDSVKITSPSSSTTYWDDKAIECAINLTGYQTETKWLINGVSAICTNGELAENLPAGEHTLTVRISKDGETIENEVTITVKEGFSVSLDKPEENSDFFVGDEVSCAATITPEKYKEHLEITVGGEGCTSSGAKLTKAGETTVRAFATILGRTEFVDAVVTAKPVIAGKVHPLTADGVVSQRAGFTVTLEAGGDVIDTGTTTDGSFAIKSDHLSDLSDELVTLSVTGRSGEFYSSRAIIPADKLSAIIAEDRLGFVLAPKQWQIRCGPLSGESTTIKLPEAFKRYDAGNQYASFYMLFKIIDKRFYRKLLPEDRPLKTAFDRVDSEVAITAADSTAFWRETTRVEETICRGDLFVPATIDEVPTNRDGVLVAAIGADNGPSGAAGPNEHGHIKGGSMSLPTDDFGAGSKDRSSLRHELAQVLGFGEQDQWYGITSSNMSGPPGFSDEYSVNDVSHIQLYMDAVDLQAEENIAFGVYGWRQVFDIPSLPDN